MISTKIKFNAYKMDYSFLKTKKPTKIDYSFLVKDKKEKEEKKEKISFLPKFLGGGAYNTVIGKPNTLKKTEAKYGLIPKEEEDLEGHHIIPVSMGGTSETPYNMENLTKEDHARITKVGNEALSEYKAGKISLPEMRLKTMTEYQKIFDEKQGITESVIDNLFKSTKAAFKSIKPSLKTKIPDYAPYQIAKDYVKAIYETDKEEISRVADLLKSKDKPYSAENISKTLKVITGGVGVAMSPITAAFASVENVPVLSTLSKIVSLPIAVGGDVVREAFSAALKLLPIDEKTKNKLNEAVEEVGQLAGELTIGGALFKKGETFIKKKAELVKKYGKQDAETIIKKAEEKAVNTIKAETAITEQKKPVENKYDFLTAKEKYKNLKVEEAEIKQIGLDGKAEIKTESKIVPEVKGETIEQTASRMKAEGKTLEEFVKSVKSDPKRIPTTPEYQKFSRERDKFIKREKEIYTEMKSMRDKYIGKTIKDVPTSEITKYDNLQKELNKTLSKKTLAKIPEGVIKTHIGENGLISQLTDIWNKAQKVETPKIAEKPAILGEKESGIAKKLSERFEADREAIGKKYEKAGYNPAVVKEQFKMAKEITADMERTERILRGEEPLPENMRVGIFLEEASRSAIANKSDALKNLITKSPLTSETSRYASETRMLAEIEPNSPITKSKEIKAAREKAFEQKTGKKADKSKKETVENIKNEQKMEINKIDLKEIDDFISKIICK